MQLNSENNTVDAAEIAKFAMHANDWWQTDGPLKTLHDINPVRIEWIASYVKLSGQSLLDIGCGGGILAEGLAREGAIVTGLDAEEGAIKAASEHANASSLAIQYICSALDTFEPKEKFDVITCLEMLEHVEHPEVIIEKAATLLKPGGYLFLSTINRTLKAYLTAIVGAEYVLSILPRETHTFERFIKPHELAKCVRSTGLDVIGTTGLLYNPFTRKARLALSELDVNYLMVAKG